MGAFVVFTTGKAVGDNEVENYLHRMKPSFEPYEVIVRAPRPPSGNSGPHQPRMVVVEFPTLKEAADWYAGESFHSIRDPQFRGVIYSQSAFESIDGVDGFVYS
ncbi:DUF1330 domain-containing protein [Mycobacterium paraterrae]|uniref:DUF1330 domain-containing protein n=1 Tax=Mycobacterium paraterrae TaxID=577492 RepID=A0ABY3VRE2_9MYCO|nr:DUF1330 domain-containing protein [Mycobacterium paraterrae]UMB69753.1 DUF1330 domain-containing protein [Mycobacterium paraterrae]